MNSRNLTTVLRALAIVIAIAGAIDPGIAVTTAIRPEVAVVADPRLPDPGLRDRVASTLADRFEVVMRPPFGSAAVVTVGDSLPPAAQRTAPVAFAVSPAAAAPFVTITGLQAPAHGNAHAQIPVRVTVRARAAVEQDVVVSLRLGQQEIDRQTIRPTSDDHAERVELRLLGGVTGPVPFTVVAAVADSTHEVERAVTIDDDTWQVLSFDRRPSWASAFVRRALETDPRFSVVSRVATSRGVSSSTGDAPQALSAAELDRFDAVIVGGLDALSASDIASVQGFMRDPGGSVLLLPDDPEPPPALRQLSGIERWSATAANDPTGVPLATETIAPASRPVWALVGDDRSVRISMAAGELIVAGAMDSWRHRQRDAAAFDRYWQLTVADAAARARARPGPAAPTAADTDRDPVPDDRELVAAWTGAHRGKVVAENDLSQLAEAVTAVLSPPVEQRTIHPMRSGWWILPFGALLGVEWWTRRRRGEK